MTSEEFDTKLDKYYKESHDELKDEFKQKLAELEKIHFLILMNTVQKL
ncbi:hypothetical protein MOO44_00620 (plasmid) [Nicoliella spurrieriana]|uniref:Uncharacterized protein n=1 Tax=Nicoliella spurrieriana TaxID=2925830 RepID=A0A976X553_9LACO|nr:hypothetical protein [Nicoliella spurrieriana]UQS86177.1 hypothetical protein MOO44_00620 [Nicoliella spurrieriana]